MLAWRASLSHMSNDIACTAMHAAIQTALQSTAHADMRILSCCCASSLDTQCWCHCCRSLNCSKCGCQLPKFLGAPCHVGALAPCHHNCGHERCGALQMLSFVLAIIIAATSASADCGSTLLNVNFNGETGARCFNNCDVPQSRPAMHHRMVLMCTCQHFAFPISRHTANGRRVCKSASQC